MQEKYITTQILEKLANMDQLTRSMSAQHPVSAIDAALLRKTCVELYELILQAEKPQETVFIKTPAAQNPQENIAAADETDIQETLHIFANEQLHESSVSLINDIPQLPEETENPLPVIEEQIATTPATEKEEEVTPPLAQELNLIKAEDELLHEKIAKTVSTQTDLSQKFQSKVESLKAAITLNRKIAFVNELFKENTVEYATAIEALNNAIDLTDALRIFSELKYNYNWEESNALVKELESLVVKRYQAV
jgi:hypothetical protein